MHHPSRLPCYRTKTGPLDVLTTGTYFRASPGALARGFANETGAFLPLPAAQNRCRELQLLWSHIVTNLVAQHSIFLLSPAHGIPCTTFPRFVCFSKIASLTIIDCGEIVLNSAVAKAPGEPWMYPISNFITASTRRLAAAGVAIRWRAVITAKSSCRVEPRTCPAESRNPRVEVTGSRQTEMVL